MSKPIVGNEGEGSTVVSDDKPDDSSQMVKFESYQKVLSQKKAQDEKLKEMQSKLAEFEAAETVKVEAKLREEKRFDEIITTLKTQKEEAVTRLGQVQTEIAQAVKRQALESLIGGFAHPDYAKFADLDTIGLNADGTVDAEALNREATRIREVHPHLLKPAASPTQSGAPRTAFEDKQKPAVELSWNDAAKDFMNKKGK